jgi:peptidoglycan/xylan/chitin deacetylase (PgdA/CDA1 family)
MATILIEPPCTGARVVRRHPSPRWSAPRKRLLVAVVSVLAISTCSPATHQTTKAVEAPATTVVSLTFDDVSADQYVAGSMLAAHGMKGTFFVSSNLTGKYRYYMTWDQVQQLAAAGNEIGGHTLDHVDLRTVGPAEQRRQICDDRQNLIRRGYAVIDFAYPYSGVNPSAEATVKECGYRSGRAVGGLDCPDCRKAEVIPPRDAYRTRTLDGVLQTTSLSDMKRWVTDAEQSGGGWVQFVFHHICDGCRSNSVKASDLVGLLDWLQPRASQGTVVMTIAQVLELQPVG